VTPILAAVTAASVSDDASIHPPFLSIRRHSLDQEVEEYEIDESDEEDDEEQFEDKDMQEEKDGMVGVMSAVRLSELMGSRLASTSSTSASVSMILDVGGEDDDDNDDEADDLEDLFKEDDEEHLMSTMVEIPVAAEEMRGSSGVGEVRGALVDYDMHMMENDVAVVLDDMMDLTESSIAPPSKEHTLDVVVDDSSTQKGATASTASATASSTSIPKKQTTARTKATSRAKRIR
jgi:hypothetical protein